MKLKYGILFLVVNCSLIGTAFAEVTDGTGTVTIKGEVVNQTCTVENNGDISFTLPTVSKTTLNSKGKVAGMTPFHIQLTNCLDKTTNSNNLEVKSIGVYFSGFNVDTNGTLKNMYPNGANNVNVQLLDKDENIINPNDTPETQVKYTENASSIVNGSITLDYYARYYAKGPSTAGKVQASIPFVIVYK